MKNKLLLITILAGFLASSVHAQVLTQDSVKGALIGAGIGAIIGNNTGSRNAEKGALIGAGIGLLAGSELSNQRVQHPRIIRTEPCYTPPVVIYREVDRYPRYYQPSPRVIIVEKSYHRPPVRQYGYNRHDHDRRDYRNHRPQRNYQERYRR